MEIYLLEADGTDVRTITTQDIKSGIAIEKDLGLDLTSIRIGAPEIWEHYREIPGGDVIDLTEFTGRVEYKSRTVLISADRHEDYGEWLVQSGDLAQMMHGKKFHVMLGDDETHYFTGRCKLSTNKVNPVITEYTFEFYCEPMRHILPSLAELYTDFETGATSSNQFFYYDIYVGSHARNLTIIYEQIVDYNWNDFYLRRTPYESKNYIAYASPFTIETPEYTGNIRLSMSNVSKFSLLFDNKEL